MKKIIILFLAILGGFLWTGAKVTQAQPIVSDPPIIIPQEVTVRYQRVNVTIEDQIATTHIDQLFVNENDWMLEGTYFFPLPAEATVTQLTMWVDGVPIEAKILEKEEARQIYDNIVRQLRDPALLEYVGMQAVQANVFPIPPHSERRVEIEYSQILSAENGIIHYVYPQSTKLFTNVPLENQSIRVEVRSKEAIRAIYSPTHPVAVSRDGDFRAVAGFEGVNVVADQDFELYYTVSPEEIGLNLLSYRESGENGFFLLLIAPTVQVSEVVAKDVILVMDTSGSMDGEKMAQVREAAAYIVGHLNPEDRFNIVAFSTGTTRFAPELVPANRSGDYRAFLNSLLPVGGTNISQALLETAEMADPARPTTIIFLTDGLATEGITDTQLLLDAVKQAMPENVRLFAFGVGDDVDTVLLDSLAQNHRGTTTYVRPFQAIDEAVSSFFAKVNTPVMTDLELEVDGIVVEDLYPPQLPDLFAGTQLVVVGRYRDGGPATITLRGQVNGEEQVFTYPDLFFRIRSGESFIPRLWATRAVGHLLTQIRLQGENPELVQSVVNLSLRYGIITPYTSFLIEEDDIFSQTGRAVIEEEAMSLAATPAPFTGAEAVSEAATQAEMTAAEAPLPLATRLVTEEVVVEGKTAVPDTPIQYAGSKTFVWRDGKWIDTAYQPERHTRQQVGFATNTYFELLDTFPELADYFSLGTEVLVVYEGQAYEVVEGLGETAVTLPDNSPNTPAPTSQSQPPNPITTTRDDFIQSPTINPTANTVWFLISLLIAIPLFLGIGLLIGRHTGK
ncbi:MAG: VWA domain-containing protein [Chloroflexi bacterium]|nr:MAG: VWA domain-containing protein [Chloroflexota bacterium]